MLLQPNVIYNIGGNYFRQGKYTEALGVLDTLVKVELILYPSNNNTKMGSTYVLNW